MDLAAFHAAVWNGDSVSNPVALEALEALLDAADLPAGGRALDLGCGAGRLALALAERRALRVDAVDLSSAMLAAAGRAAAASPAGALVRFRRARAEAVLAESGPPYDLIVAAGVHGVVAGATEPPAGARSVAARLKPGGAFLLADTVWRRAPGPRAAAAMPGYAAKSVYVAACAAAGLELLAEHDSAPQDWRAYFDRMAATLARAPAADARDRAAAAAHRERLDRIEALYAAEADAVGFTSLLFVAPSRRPRP